MPNHPAHPRGKAREVANTIVFKWTKPYLYIPNCPSGPRKAPMDEIHRFRAKTLELKGTNPVTGEPFGHSVKNSNGLTVSGPESKTFHNELQALIGKSATLEEFNMGLRVLIKRWRIDPKLLPPFPTN